MSIWTANFTFCWLLQCAKYGIHHWHKLHCPTK